MIDLLVALPPALNQMTFCRIWLRPYDNFFQLYFENLPKLKTLRFSIHSLAQVDLDLFKKLGTIENLAIWFYESTPFFMDIKNVLSNLKLRRTSNRSILWLIIVCKKIIVIIEARSGIV